MQNKNKLSWGYIAGIVSGITYGMNPLFGVPVINKGLDVNSLLFYRYGVATLLMLAYMLVAKRQIRITWKQFGLMAILGVLFTGCSITLFEAYKYIPSGIATSILYVYPIMVALIMMFFGQFPSWKTWISIFAGVAGAILLSLKGGGGFIDWRGIALVVASGLCYTLFKPEPASQGHPQSHLDFLLLLDRLGDVVCLVGFWHASQCRSRCGQLAECVGLGDFAYGCCHHHFGSLDQGCRCHKNLHPRHPRTFDRYRYWHTSIP